MLKNRNKTEFETFKRSLSKDPPPDETNDQDGSNKSTGKTAHENISIFESNFPEGDNYIEEVLKMSKRFLLMDES